MTLLVSKVVGWIEEGSFLGLGLGVSWVTWVISIDLIAGKTVFMLGKETAA
jgi:hypothetical protein